MDSDLNSLLDDALEDFEKPIANSRNKTLPEHHDDPEAAEDLQIPSVPPPTDMFKEFFGGDMTAKLQEEWNSALKELNDENPDLAKHMNMMSLSADSTADTLGASGSKVGFDGKMKEALESMAKSLEEDIPQEDFMKNFPNLGLNDLSADGELPELGMMEDMMKTMLSKEMLYPPMKEMCKNYPAWLDNNVGSLSKVDKENYQKQLECLQKICAEFESETDCDTDNVKKARFVSIMDTVNEMQQYGQPPNDLTGEPHSLPSDSCTVS